jgi:hypothetical protein
MGGVRPLLKSVSTALIFLPHLFPIGVLKQWLDTWNNLSKQKLSKYLEKFSNLNNEREEEQKISEPFFSHS